MTEAAYRWLVSEAARPWLARAAENLPSTPNLVLRLRRDLTAEQAAVVCQQAELRVRARAKFSRAESMYFTPLGLEQATDERIAAYKATSFATPARIVDLCCGIGGDLLGLAGRATVVGVDCDPTTTIVARANLAVSGHSADQVICREVSELSLSEFDAWHIDPDRRPDQQRTTNIDRQRPSWAVIEKMLRQCPNAAIKLAPATTTHLAERAELEWIGSRRECKQLLVRCGTVARYPGQRTATIVDASGLSQTVVPRRGGKIAHRNEVGTFLYEAHPTLLAARIVQDVAADGRLESFALRGPNEGAAWGYLTSDEPRDLVGFGRFRVLQALPFDRKQLTASVRDNQWNIREVKKRGSHETPDQIRSWLPKTDGEPVILFVATTSLGVRAIVAQRETTPLDDVFRSVESEANAPS